MAIYEPAEDSYLMQKYVREFALGRVLDIGTGSGIQALTAITNPNAHFVLAVDKDPAAVNALQEKIKKERIRKLQAAQSDLFSHVPGQFNLILFNPPYLPQDRGIHDDTIYGGKKGYEISEQFLREASCHLFPDGKILFLFSSLTNKEKIQEILRHHLWQFRELEREKHAFEELYLYLVEKSPLLRELEKKGLADIHYFTHGTRGDIYTAMLDQSQFVKKYLPRAKKNIKVAVKVARLQSTAKNRMENEARWLQAVNRGGIGPRYLFHGEGYVAYEFVDGIPLAAWQEQHGRDEILRLLRKILEQCAVLDSMNITKEEMHRPFKHILVTSAHHPVLLDFERGTPTPKPKNVTQFIEFLCRMSKELSAKGIIIPVPALRELAKEYKKTYRRAIIENVIKLLG